MPYRKTPAPQRATEQRIKPIADAMHYTILAVDVERFNAPERTNLHRVAVRSGLYRAVEEALTTSGVRWQGCHRSDLGDGVLLLAPGAYPKAVFGERVPQELAKNLLAHNIAHTAEEQIRLRMALHAGEITRDAHGFTGSAIIHTFRLLDSRAVKDALSVSEGDIAVITSNWFYEEVIRHIQLGDPGSYTSVFAAVKETTTRAWLHLPAVHASAG
ncbi:hypothetical protein [Amycolatopsis kentuckyensis]|uniref:hypothetical protein n=1 Tax=Amycolatopsis kentuckyensis TaxID=218823 RepID=UPI000A36FA4E|nr:hypothetical protein [Amycolatopsis kentuckyensis]